MSEALVSERGDFRWSLYEVITYHTLYGNLPGSRGLGHIINSTGLDRRTLYSILKKLSERGLVEIDKKERTRYMYKALQIGNTEIREIFEEHDDSMEIYFALDKKWLDLGLY